MDSLVVSYRKDGVDDRRKVMVVSDLIVGVVKHPKGGADPKFEVWISVQGEAGVDWQVGSKPRTLIPSPYSRDPTPKP